MGKRFYRSIALAECSGNGLYNFLFQLGLSFLPSHKLGMGFRLISIGKKVCGFHTQGFSQEVKVFGGGKTLANLDIADESGRTA